MSVLAPIYFLGGLAIGLPILFHLIRRQPKGEIEFGSLMFLRPTPPRLTRRSRLDQWPLLLIRGLVLLLLATAFTRPFWRSESMAPDAIAGNTVVLAIDTSASMRREGLWPQVVREANAAIDALDESDSLAIMTFDQTANVVWDFDGGLDLMRSNVYSQTRDLAKKQINDLEPSYLNSNLSKAIDYARSLITSRDRGILNSDSQGMIILISDLADDGSIGSQPIDAWPKNVLLDIRPVRSSVVGNAWVTIPIGDVNLDKLNENEREAQTRIRIHNTSDSKNNLFKLFWRTREGGHSSAMPFQVPAGQSRLVQMTSPPKSVEALVLSGDDCDFDNIRYWAKQATKSYRVLFVGDESENRDPRDSLFYYLDRVPMDDTHRSVQLESVNQARLGSFDFSTVDARGTPLVVVTCPLDADQARGVQSLATKGTCVLLVLRDQADHTSMNETARLLLDEANLATEESPLADDDYVMLSSIDFAHPLFAALDDPKFNDFTKVRFWSHRILSGFADETKVIASFDNDAPAVMQRSFGEGNVFVMTSGWQPNESQLALSTKFIPLILAWFDLGTPSLGIPSRFYIGAKEASAYTSPGIYFREGQTNAGPIAVNIDPSESRVEPIELDTFERLGIQMGKAEGSEATVLQQRQKADIELESSQSIWKWLLICVLGLIGLETWLGGRLSQPSKGET